jgi:RsiW-degrading membrane proteinase PrsW (M82 family)
VIGFTAVALLVLVLPILPGVVWMWIVYRTDRYEPEPKSLVLSTFLMGAVAVVPAYLAERGSSLVYPFLDEIERASACPVHARPEVWPILLGCFLLVGPCEELAKFAAVRLYIFRHPEFDEPLDGVIYASAAALGFASLENVLYVIDFERGLHVHWDALGLRSFLALPGHVIFAATWGHALGRRRFDPAYPVWSRVALAAGLHGLYDFVQIYPPTRPLILLYMSIMVPVVMWQIRTLREDSPFAPRAPDEGCAARDKDET